MIAASSQETLRKNQYPLMEDKGIGFILAFCAGLMNAWTFYHAQTFATVQSGNVVQVGYRLVQGDWSAFWFAFGSVIAFGLGSAFCGVVMTTLLSKGRNFTIIVLWCECLGLALISATAFYGIVRPEVLALAISFVAGMQGNAFHKDHGMLYGNVAVTFVVQMAFNFLAQSFFKKDGINGEPNLMWSGIFFFVLLGFASGGALGFYIDKIVKDNASLIIATFSLLLVALIAKNRRKTSDPTSGATFV
ncbi:YoaK family protein [Acetobacter sp. DmW_043]|uniref:YoaK family protein n=1 Tax=Acetobacter sp. DmW_043 TaxID=1670658 RepID=UPI000A38422B|nr:YoaK family protein [Acetobacter sp. DmW_043]